MVNFNFPLKCKFKIGTISNDFLVYDSTGDLIFYVREKIFSWKDKIRVYSDDSKNELIYELVSNKVIDFQQTFSIFNSKHTLIGKLKRKSIKSLWRSSFKLMDQNNVHDFDIKEKNPFTKFLDGIFGEIPLLGFFSGYILNPSYILKNIHGELLFEIVKEPSFFGRKFSINKVSHQQIDQERLVVSILLMILNERNRG